MKASSTSRSTSSSEAAAAAGLWRSPRWRRRAGLGPCALLPGVLALLSAGCAGEGPPGLAGGTQPPGSGTPSTPEPGATVDFATEVQPIFDANCACHLSPNAPEGAVLLEGVAFDTLVGVPSTQNPDLLLVDPGAPERSYLLVKIDDAVPDAGELRRGDRMPEGLPPLPAQDIETIRQWIEEGAPRTADPPGDGDDDDGSDDDGQDGDGDDDGDDDDGDGDDDEPPEDDRTAPGFAGVADAVAVGPSAIEVSWDAASDDRTAAAGIVYEVFVARSAGGQDFSSPDRSVEGVTSTRVDGLEPGTEHFVAVRAVDEAGNRDANTAEVRVTTPPAPPPPFLRGDVDGDGSVGIEDAVKLLGHLFRDGAAPVCTPVADADANGELELADALRVLEHLFGSGEAPVPLGEEEIAACKEADKEAVARGEAVFLEPAPEGNLFACATCHAAVPDAGASLRRPGHSLHDVLRRPSYHLGRFDDFREAANVCREAWMQAPPWEAGDAGLRDLEAFLESLAPEDPVPALTFEIVPPAVEGPSSGDPDAGCVVFHETCVVCHGEGAEGTALAPSLVAFPFPPDFIRRKARLSGAPRELYPELQGGSMPFWSAERLSDSELEDLVAYLRARPLPECAPEDDGGGDGDGGGAAGGDRDGNGGGP